MTNFKLTTFGQTCIVRVIPIENKIGVIILSQSTVKNTESVVGEILVPPQFITNPDGSFDTKTKIAVGDKVCFQMGSGSTVVHKDNPNDNVLTIPFDCILYKVETS